MDDFYHATKEAIFDAAIQLIAQFGFEKIGMREIAKTAGIKAGSIYNHYASKQEILDHIYTYYEAHFLYARKSPEEMKKLLLTSAPLEFIYALHFDFSHEGEKNYIRMSLIVKIIIRRIFDDLKANQLFLELMTNQSIIYAKEIIDYGIAIGRIKPIDSQIFAFSLNGQLIMMAIKAFADPVFQIGHLEDEDRIKHLFASMLQFNDIIDKT